MKIAVVGAGIAGLTAAGGLAAQGHQVRVYESGTRATFGRGAFFMVDDHTLSQATNTLASRSLYQAAVPLRGTKLGTSDPKPSDGGMWQFARSHLLDLLLETCQDRGVVVEFDAPVRSLTDEGDGVTIEVAGEGTRVDAVVAADGTFSAVRAVIDPDTEPTYCGQQVLYATMPGRPRSLTAPDGFVHFMPARDRAATLGYISHPSRSETSWFLRVNSDENPALNANQIVSAASTALDDDAAKILAELAESSASAVATRAFNVTLIGRVQQIASVPIIGDADHAITPASGNGARNAFIDASVLTTGIERGTVVADLARRRSRLLDDRRKLMKRGFPGVTE